MVTTTIEIERETMGEQPVSISLSTFEADAEKALAAAAKVGAFVAQYGSLIPGLSPYVNDLGIFDKIVNGALTLFKA
jgi:hypothetical protein